FFQAEDGIRDLYVTGVQTCALPILGHFLPGTIFRALGPAIGARAMAAGADSICLITVHGETAAAPFTYTFFCVGGMGARAAKDRSEERRVGKECRCRWGAEQ